MARVIQRNVRAHIAGQITVLVKDRIINGNDTIPYSVGFYGAYLFAFFKILEVRLKRFFYINAFSGLKTYNVGIVCRGSGIAVKIENELALIVFYPHDIKIGYV